MRTSGRGSFDLLMLSVPLAILVVFGVMSGGGVENILRTCERAMWSAVEWIGTLMS